jgi:hypothetical protein
MSRRFAFFPLAAFLLPAFLCTNAQAQTLPPFSVTVSDLAAARPAVPALAHLDLAAATPIHVTPHDPPPESVVRRPGRAWFALSLAGQAAALADVKTTLDLKSVYRLTFYENDPLARPFVNLPPPAYITSAVGLTAGASAISWELRRSEHPLLRRFWWAPQAVQIVLNSECAIRNTRQ